MIYSFSSEDIFDDNLDTIRLLDSIYVNSLNRHVLYIGSQQIFDSILRSEWYNGLRDIDKHLIEVSYESSIYITRSEVKINISKNADDYSLIEAEAILKQKLKIILENIEYDYFFLEAMIKNFEKESEKISEHLSNNWIEFQNGGGNNIPNLLNMMEKSFNDRGRFPKDFSHYCRCFVIIDSDKKYPSVDEVSDDKRGLLEEIKSKVGTCYHVTLKREMENYMPKEVFLNIKDNQDYINSYLKLKDVQKDFIDVEKGLIDKNVDQYTPDELRELFSDIKNPDLNNLRKKSLELRGANGKKISFKANFSKYFQSDCVTKKNLKERDSKDELELILMKITKLL